MLRVGLVGLGHVARHHVAALERSSDFELVAGCDPDEQKHALLPGSVRIHRDFKSLLDEPQVDVVVVASPNRLHVEHGQRVMEAGRWLLMEKPLAENRIDFESFARKKRQINGRCTVALHAAFGREVEWLAKHRERLGLDADSIAGFSAEFDDPYVADGVLLPRAESLGGSWLDSGINALSVIARMMPIDRLQVLSSSMRRESSSACSELEARVELGTDGESLRGTIETSWIRNRDRKVTVLLAADGSREIIIHHSDQKILLREDGRESELFASDNGLERLTNHYTGVFRDLARQIESGEDNFEYAERLHKLFFDVAEDGAGAPELSGKSADATFQGFEKADVI